MVEDITEQRKAEEARFRHAAIVESSEDAIASGTLDGIIVSWNPCAQHMYGYTEAEAVGKPIGILVPPELRDEEKNILETVKAGGYIEQLETVRVTKTGKRINQGAALAKRTQPLKNLLHPDDRAKVMNLADSSIKSGQPTEGEWRVLWATARTAGRVTLRRAETPFSAQH